MKTSEFALTCLVLVGATILAFVGKISDVQWMGLATIAVSSYSVSRGITKKGTGQD